MYRLGYWNLLFLIANIKAVLPRKVGIWHDEGLWRALVRRGTWLQAITKMLLLAYDGMLLDTYFLWLVRSLTEVLIRNIRGKFPLLVKRRKSTKWIKLKTSSLMTIIDIYYAYKLQGLGATDCEQPLISVQTPSTVRYTGMLKTLRRRNMGMYFTHSFITSICQN